MNFIKVVSVTIFLVISSSSMAADETISAWKSSAELGYVNVSGNTNTETTKAAFDLSYDIEKWTYKVHADTLSSKTETRDTTTIPSVVTEERTAAKWLASGQIDYKFSDVDYFFGLLSYEDDRFSGFDYQAKLGLGYGRWLIKSDVHNLKLEAGPGYRSYRLVQLAPPAPLEETQDDSLLRANAGYIWKVSETSTFKEDLTYEAGQDQDEWKSVSALTAKINSTLAMKISHTVKHLEVVPAGSKNYDRETAVTLVFTF